MPSFLQVIVDLYIPLIGWTLGGWLLGRYLPKQTTTMIGRFLFWVGVPISIVTFLRGAQLSKWIWIAPLTAWVAMLFGAVLAWIWIDLGVTEEKFKALSQGIWERSEGEGRSPVDRDSLPSQWSLPTRGSFILAMMCGNTAYLGYPIILNLVGQEYFAWGLFYDLLGSFFGVYIFGVGLATYFGTGSRKKQAIVQALLKNPALWSLILGLVLRSVAIPSVVEGVLERAAWGIVSLALIVVGMQLGQLISLSQVQKALTCLSIKMIVVPLVVGTGLMFFGIEGSVRMALVLQMAMPPSFATLVVAQAYNLDRDLAVTTIVLGSVSLLFTLPLWLLLFGGQ